MHKTLFLHNIQISLVHTHAYTHNERGIINARMHTISQKNLIAGCCNVLSFIPSITLLHR